MRLITFVKFNKYTKSDGSGCCAWNRSKPPFCCRGQVSVPLDNYYEGTIEDAPNLVWKGKIEFVKLMENQFHLPILVTNDANAAALGEAGDPIDIKAFERTGNC